MAPELFKLLSLNDKADLIWQKGTCVGDRAIYNQVHIILYKVHGFYTEVYYNASSNALERIEVVPEDEILEKYIDLRELYSSNTAISPPQR